MGKLKFKIPMINSTYQFDFNDLNLKSSDIEAVLGYKEGEDRHLSPVWIEEVLGECTEISKIRAQFTIFNNVQFDDNSNRSR